jgi:hypothetical protein
MFEPDWLPFRKQSFSIKIQYKQDREAMVTDLQATLPKIFIQGNL